MAKCSSVDDLAADICLLCLAVILAGALIGGRFGTLQISIGLASLVLVAVFAETVRVIRSAKERRH